VYIWKERKRKNKRKPKRPTLPPYPIINIYEMKKYIGSNLSASGGYVPVTYTGVMGNQKISKIETQIKTMNKNITQLRNTSIALSLLLLSSLTYAQKTKSKINTRNDFGKSKYIKQLISTPDENVYALFEQNSRYSIATIQHLNITDELDLMGECKLTTFNSKILLFSTYDRRKQSRSMRVISDGKPLNQNKSVDIFKSKSNDKLSKLTYNIHKASKNEKYLSCITENTTAAKQKYEIYTYLFDEDLNPLWNSHITLPFTMRLGGRIEQHFVSNNGNFYVLYSKVSERGGPRTYSVVRIGKDGIEAEYDFNSKNSFIVKELSLTDDHSIKATGYYPNDNSPYSSLILDEETLEFLELIDVTGELSSDNKFASANNPKATLDYKPKIELEDGGTIIIAEELISYLGEYSTKYEYFDIRIRRLSASGNEVWTKTIHKKQLGYYSSFVSFINDESLSFFFYDHIENENKQNTADLKDYKYPFKKSAFMKLSIDLEEGTLGTREIITPLSLGLGVQFKLNCQIEENKVIFKTNLDKSCGLIEVSLN
jgi:hypothetical protein